MHVHMHSCVHVHGPVLSRYRSSTSLQKTYSGLSNCYTATGGQREEEGREGVKKEKTKGETSKERERDGGQEGEKGRYERRGLEMDWSGGGRQEKQEGARACCLSPLLSDGSVDLYHLLSKVTVVTWERSNFSDSHTHTW